MVNVLIPMAGLGSRFVKNGITVPKPFIDVLGKPMIVRVLENLKCKNAKYILLSRKEHMDSSKELVEKIQNNYDAVFVPIDRLTEGAACTVLFAREYINNEDPLVIANSDQIVDVNFADYVNSCSQRKLDGLIMTFNDPFKDTKWSFARIDENGLVVEVKEKIPISDIATVGIYMFAHGKDYVDAAMNMIIRNDRVNNEFYVCPTYNYAVKNRKKIGIYNINFEKMHGIGTPEDLNMYKELIKCTA